MNYHCKFSFLDLIYFNNNQNSFPVFLSSPPPPPHLLTLTFLSLERSCTWDKIIHSSDLVWLHTGMCLYNVRFSVSNNRLFHLKVTNLLIKISPTHHLEWWTLLLKRDQSIFLNWNSDENDRYFYEMHYIFCVYVCVFCYKK